MTSGSTVLIPPSLPGTPNLQAEIQYCACFQIDHTQHNVSFGLIVGQQGEHTKDAVYIDSERRFQELEKACAAQRSIASRARLMKIREHRRRRNYMKNQRSKSIQLQVLEDEAEIERYFDAINGPYSIQMASTVFGLPSYRHAQSSDRIFESRGGDL